MKYHHWLILGGITLLAGCAAAHPCIHGKGGVCLNARTMYGVTNHRDQVNPDKETLREDAMARKLLREPPSLADQTPNLHPNTAPTSGSSAQATGSSKISTSSAGVPGETPGSLMAPLQYPKPLITQPSVLRVWVAPYRGPEGNLHFPGVVYSILHPQHWDFAAGSARVPVPVE
ncbi:type IV conjugative transfer system protein TraV [Acidithiobacillus marinus]|uniref:Type IV conjugative transfer system protein TraV n=1 Tax=Acidithiobacillus marinus TaxID=187490 RepID=A0A2I1DPJ2_9PROT|nr:type IV conjugative transfer system lipoprotein TraV [Acidithiobacillus marinus]PKY11834.1 type IV conjugative transfer system protein TraV [Acidithiobacillus marinus]